MLERPFPMWHNIINSRLRHDLGMKSVREIIYDDGTKKYVCTLETVTDKTDNSLLEVRRLHEIKPMDLAYDKSSNKISLSTYSRVGEIVKTAE